MGSRASQRAQVVRHIAEFPDQFGVAEFAGRRIPTAAERDRAGAAGLARERLRAHDGRIGAQALHSFASGSAVVGRNERERDIIG